MQVKMMSVDALIPYARNPRRNDDAVDAVAASIKEFGFKQPIVVDCENVVVVGHTRLKAAKKLGIKEVPTVIADDLTPDQIKAYRILDNKLNEKAEWDGELLSLELDEIELDLAPFEVDFEDDITEPEPDITEDETPPLMEAATTEPGDMWILGEHRIFCGDSTKGHPLPPSDVTFTSPPYNRGAAVKLANKSVGDSSYVSTSDDLSDEGYEKFLGEVLQASLATSRVVAINLQILAGNKRAVLKWLAQFSEKFVDVLIWDKRLAQPAAAANVVNTAHEFVFIFSPNKEPTRAIETANFHGDKCSIVRVDAQHSNEFAETHAATMPIEFAAECLGILGGSSVFEPFCGTGTTIIAAEQLGRSCNAIELEPRYVDVAVRRWQQFTGRDAILESTGETFAEVDQNRE